MRGQIVCPGSAQFVVALKELDAEREVGWAEWIERETIIKKKAERQLEELLDQKKKLGERLERHLMALKKREKLLGLHVGTAEEGEACGKIRKRKSTTNERGGGKNEKNKVDVEREAGNIERHNELKKLLEH